jgi:hypothetical protein
MSDDAEPDDPDVLRPWPRRGAAILGTGCTVAGAIAVFVTNNGAGAAALLIAAFAFCLMALTGRAVLVKFPGGGEVSATAKLGAKVETVTTLAAQGHLDAASQVLDNALADSLRRGGAENPEATVKAIRAWPELKTLVNRVRDALNSGGVEFATVPGKDVPRLRATVDQTDYGLYVMPGSDTKTWWVGKAVAAARKLPGDVRPVLVTESPPSTAVIDAARAANVPVVWLSADGTVHDAPW